MGNIFTNSETNIDDEIENVIADDETENVIADIVDNAVKLDKKQIFDQHQMLWKKIDNDNMDTNFIVYDFPYHHGEKDCYTQLVIPSDEKEFNPKYNKFCIPSLNILITNDGVEENDPKQIRDICSFGYEKGYPKGKIYKYFTFDKEQIPADIIEDINKIKELKLKISNSDYVKKKLNMKPINLEAYIDVYNNRNQYI